MLWIRSRREQNHTKEVTFLNFVEDDYLHQVEAFKEMIFSYERISSQISRELILCPADYPYLYTKIEPTNIFIGSTKHWRKVDETLCTFLISNKLLENIGINLSLCVNSNTILLKNHFMKYIKLNIACLQFHLWHYIAPT